LITATSGGGAWGFGCSFVQPASNPDNTTATKKMLAKNARVQKRDANNFR
jgi:hypothetical protein